jgi:hypothetical protein
MHYCYPPEKGWVSPDRLAASEIPSRDPPAQFIPDIWAEYTTEYPSGYILPFHYKHPVTGKATSENKHNAGLKLEPNKYRI